MLLVTVIVAAAIAYGRVTAVIVGAIALVVPVVTLALIALWGAAASFIGTAYLPLRSLARMFSTILEMISAAPHHPTKR